MNIATWLEAIEDHPSTDATTLDIAGYLGLLHDTEEVFDTGYPESEIHQAVEDLVRYGFFRHVPERDELVFTLP